MKTNQETYAIDDGFGNCITTGLQGYDYAKCVAQTIANARGESVYLYDLDDSEDCEPEQVRTTLHR